MIPTMEDLKLWEQYHAPRFADSFPRRSVGCIHRAINRRAYGSPSRADLANSNFLSLLRLARKNLKHPMPEINPTRARYPQTVTGYLAYLAEHERQHPHRRHMAARWYRRSPYAVTVEPAETLTIRIRPFVGLDDDQTRKLIRAPTNG